MFDDFYGDPDEFEKCTDDKEDYHGKNSPWKLLEELKDIIKRNVDAGVDPNKDMPDCYKLNLSDPTDIDVNDLFERELHDYYIDIIQEKSYDPDYKLSESKPIEKTYYLSDDEVPI